MAILVMLNNFAHDFSAAGWLFCTVLLWWMFRSFPTGNGAGVLTGMMNIIISLMRISLAGIVVFGIVRALAYKQFEWNAVAGDAQVTLLIVKHILLTGVFAMGVVFYRKARKRIKEEPESN